MLEPERMILHLSYPVLSYIMELSELLRILHAMILMGRLQRWSKRLGEWNCRLLA